MKMLDLDGDEAPVMAFDVAPASIERLQGDGGWKPVRFSAMPNGNVRLSSPVLAQRPAIFRWKGP